MSKQSSRFRLRDLTVYEVSLVDQGANPEANIVLFKRGDIISSESRKNEDPCMNIEELAKKLEELEAANKDLVTKVADSEKAAEDLKKAHAIEIEKIKVDFETATKKGDDTDLKKLKELQALPEEVRKQYEAITKKLEETEKALAKERDARINEMYEKRAESEYPNLPGKPAEKGLLIKLLDGLPESEQKYGFELLKSANEALGTSFKSVGLSIVKDADKQPEQQIAKLAHKYMVDFKVASYPEAYQKVLETPEGKALYEQSVQKAS